MKEILLCLVLLTTYTYADLTDSPKALNIDAIQSVKKFYKKHLQKSCGYTATSFAQKHTQLEWKDIQKNNEFIDSVLQLCPKSSSTVARILSKENGKINFDYLMYFSIEYAKGTGKVPPC